VNRGKGDKEKSVNRKGCEPGGESEPPGGECERWDGGDGNVNRRKGDKERSVNGKGCEPGGESETRG